MRLLLQTLNVDIRGIEAYCRQWYWPRVPVADAWRLPQHLQCSIKSAYYAMLSLTFMS